MADDLLILKKGETPVMIGQVTLLADGGFNFKLPGDNPSDPGLNFVALRPQTVDFEAPRQVPTRITHGAGMLAAGVRNTSPKRE